MMRPTTHTVVLPGGSLVLPLGMAALRALLSIPAVPGKPEMGGIDPARALLGEQPLPLLIQLQMLATLAGPPHTPDSLFTWGNTGDISKAVTNYLLAICAGMGPEKPQEASPKA